MAMNFTKGGRTKCRTAKRLLYARENYKFTLLEIVESNIENDIDDRESYWKRVLMSRLESVGHNKN